MLDLNAMVMFARVVDEGGFSAAARRSQVSTSTLSRRIAQLEDDLAVRLLERDSRNLRLTPAGEIFVERCRRVAVEAALAAETADALHDEPRGRLRVSASPLFTREVLTRVLPDFLARYPAVELELYVTVRRVALIEEGFDVVVRAGRPRASSLIGRRLGESASHLVATPAWLDGIDPLTHPAELEACSCLVYSPRSGPVRWRFSRGEQAATVEPVGTRLNDLHTLLALTRAGLGPAVLPALLCADGMRDGSLVRVLPRWRLPTMPVLALYPSRHHVAPAVRAFVDALLDDVAAHPWHAD